MNKENGIDKEAHYFVLMRPLEFIPVTEYDVLTYTSSNAPEKWVECKISEERFKLDDGYKLDLVPVEPGYGVESMYVEDFLLDLESRRIVKKKPNMVCENVVWEEPLTPTVNVCHSAYILRIKNK